jgi:hypothetical protein
VGLFGKSKKREVPSLDNQVGMGSLDIPPPPVPSIDINPNSLSSLGISEPPAPPAQEDSDMAKPEMPQEDMQKPETPQEEPSFPGLDKDWTNFAQGGTPTLEPELPKPEEEIKLPSQRLISPINTENRGPLFMEMETYGEFMGEIGRLNVKLHMMDEMFVKMDSLREKEDFEIKRWHHSMDDLRRKLLYMDDALFESGR